MQMENLTNIIALNSRPKYTIGDKVWIIKPILSTQGKKQDYDIIYTKIDLIKFHNDWREWCYGVKLFKQHFSSSTSGYGQYMDDVISENNVFATFDACISRCKHLHEVIEQKV